MKSSVIAFSILIMTSLAHAGSPPRTKCSNQGATIQMENGMVKILVTMHPEAKYENLQQSDLNIEETVIQEFKNETRGCASRSVVFKSVTFSKKDGSAMPNAYNRLAYDGVLSDYVICTTSYAWMPAPGQSCFQ